MVQCLVQLLSLSLYKINCCWASNDYKSLGEMFKGRKRKSPYQWHLLLEAELVYVPAKDGQHILLGSSGIGGWMSTPTNLFITWKLFLVEFWYLTDLSTKGGYCTECYLVWIWIEIIIAVTSFEQEKWHIFSFSDNPSHQAMLFCMLFL